MPEPMIHIAIGTKAQFIKMAPLMQELGRQNIEFNLIDLGQHSLITESLRREFDLKPPDVYLSQGANVSRLSAGLAWAVKLFWQGLNKRRVKEHIFKNRTGVCLIHGDTVSTLLALYLAKQAKIKVMHIEAGLRSFDWWEPFPEEIVRLLAMRFSDVLCAPSKWAFDNLAGMGYAKKTLLISGNTSFESAQYSLAKTPELGITFPRYALVTAHRMENIFSRKRLGAVLDLVEDIARVLPVIFVQHGPTINQLKKFKLEGKLEGQKNIQLFPILSHAHFVHLINRSELVITDGGSIQEECYYLDKPCLLLRKKTERQEGLGENVVLNGLDKKVSSDFLSGYGKLRRKAPLPQVSPSQEIIKAVKTYL